MLYSPCKVITQLSRALRIEVGWSVPRSPIGAARMPKSNKRKGKAGHVQKGGNGLASRDSMPQSHKQKRLEKKRRRNEAEDDGDVPPMPEMSSGSHWNFAAPQV